MTSDLSSFWDIPDPTSLNARKQLNGLVELLPRNSPLTAAFQDSLSQNALLPTLSRFMLHPSLTLAISWTFRPLLMDLCSRWLDTDDEGAKKLEALGLLIEVHEELFPILSSFVRRFERGPLCCFMKQTEAENFDRVSLHRILLAYYRILRATPSLPRNLNWDLAYLLKLCASSDLDRGSRWLAIRCYSLQSNMSESTRIRMEQDALGEICGEDCPISYGETISGTAKEVDGWMLPVLEMSRIQDYRNSIIECIDDYYTSSENSDIMVKNEDLSPRIANVHGILLLRTPPLRSVSSSLVPTSAALLALRQLAVNVSLRRPTLLTSATSSGKMTFLNYLASLLFPSSPNQVITIHLADTSLDPRALLGSYISSPTSAGSFEWKDGVLVKAMREGRWVLLKDIDRASNEVLGLITPLVESMDDIRPIGSSAGLSLGNRGNVEAAESFVLFATRSVEVNSASSPPPLLFLGAQKWREVIVPENSLDDLRLIVDSKFPNIAGPIADNLVDIWLTLKRLCVSTSTRPVGIRDLEKFCSRVSNLLGSSRVAPNTQRKAGEIPQLSALLSHPSLREEIYLDARDVFFAAGASSKPTLEQRDAIASAVGEKLGLSEETCEWLLKRRTPTFEVEKDVDGRPIALRAGRISLAVEPMNTLTQSVLPRPFSMHKQALRLISQLAACVSSVEPVLLTGETGTGKTSVISHLASLLNKPLISLNLSNQTESSDLIGGFRPVSTRVPALELQNRFTELFQRTFSSKKNEQLLASLRKAVSSGTWKVVVKLWTETAKSAIGKLKETEPDGEVERESETLDVMDSSVPRKRRKVQGRNSLAEWISFDEDVRHFEVQHVLDQGKFSFHYVEGPLVKAIRTGSWVLLDEINLASPETLECIAGLLQSPNASITLTEQGSLEPVPRHPGFRLFACMNPATDVGKKDLPRNIRARFTEIEVQPPDDDLESLISVITHYVGRLAITDKAVIAKVAELYTDVKRLSASGKIADGSNHRPHYSMRSLSRALTFAADTVRSFGLRRALWEGFTMTFTMVLDQDSAEQVLDLARRALLSNVTNKEHFLSVRPPPPQDAPADSYIQLGPFWLSSGPNEREEVEDYILTPSVQKKLVDLARIIMTKRYPVLIEGPTSSGKTSAIEYLARRTGHNFVRINNHEHTDIQEYLGSYVSDPTTGKLVFRDGLLVRALRRGDWIVLDELNLAPTDVLEALNRLLDDNRELVIPETQEVVKPHQDFMLFATQNPPGVYAGRKVLSRALHNRFLEVHFSDVPQTELEHILCQRARIAPSYSQRIVAVFHELQKRRQVSRIFEGKEGFATLRDLFRWANRDAQGYQELADNGYMLLAERTRRPEDKLVVKDVIEKVMKVTISEDSLYSMEKLGAAIKSRGGIVWTKPMQRLFILLSRALRHNEPVLLVGETGSGKTSVCQVLAELENKVLRTVNCHQNTEAADIIGGLRPIRRKQSSTHDALQEAMKILGLMGGPDEDDKDLISKLIADRLRENESPHEREVLIAAQHALSPSRGLLGWQDGPLIISMRCGDIFLLDEISLADDSVLERLNSVLEPSRILILAEKGGDTSEEFDVVANPAFKFVSTMNPGGDFGKKELSPALRNRFTEIWVPSLMNRSDLSEIVKQSWKRKELLLLTTPLLDFIEWLMLEVKDTSLLTLRDVLSWVNFCNTLSASADLPLAALFVHGGEMTILDGLVGLTQLSAWSTESVTHLHSRACRRLRELVPEYGSLDEVSTLHFSVQEGEFRIGPFSVPTGLLPPQSNSFSFNAPTSLRNAFRLVRACQIAKPILLEGSPGVGKTSLVTALAAATGQKLCRINLSEQTDLVDLFGSDLPVEGAASGQFGWSDAEFLRALKNGDWVLLDEMNLATQSVLEGLNAVFDHRGTIYVPELDRSFSRHPTFRVFAAQNPLSQGSGRKGLPKSFLNRFTKVYIEQLTPDDLLLICQNLFPNIDLSTLRLMITFNCKLHQEVVVNRRFGISGAPWEFNLRDIMRWASLMTRSDGVVDEPWKHFNAVYGTRFRTKGDKEAVLELFASVFNDPDVVRKVHLAFLYTPESVACGTSFLSKGPVTVPAEGSFLAPSQLNGVESALAGIAHNWLVIVCGSHSSGKTSFVHALSSMSGRPLQEMALGSSSDTSDLIGSFEQTSNDFHNERFLEKLVRIINACVAQTRLKDANSLEFLLRLKEDAVSARRTRSLGMLQETLRRSLKDSLFEPFGKDLSRTLKTVLENSLSANESAPRFEWIDGPLVRAMKEGQWLLLDNVNLCSPSVLDRLNSLCEMNGSIVLTERGIDQETIFPHPDFRLFMTVDPDRGEISRAMRNRGIEVSLEPSTGEDDNKHLSVARRLSADYPALHSRSGFELERRALQEACRSRYGPKVYFGSDDKTGVDSLSSRLVIVNAVYAYLDSSYDTAIVLFVLGLSSSSDSGSFLRLFKSIGTERAMRTLELLSYVLENSSTLRVALVNTPSMFSFITKQRRPLDPYFFSPHVDWMPEHEHNACNSISLVLESFVLASSTSIELRQRENAREANMGHLAHTPASKEYDTVSQFVESALALLQNALLNKQISSRSLAEILAIFRLICFSRHIYQAACRPVADFSTLHTVSTRICRVAEGLKHVVDGLEEQANALRDAYALRTGLKIRELWHSLSRPSVPSRAINLLAKLTLVPLATQRRVIDLILLASTTCEITNEMNETFLMAEDIVNKSIITENDGKEIPLASVQAGSELASMAIEMMDLANLRGSLANSKLQHTTRLLGSSVTLAHHTSRMIAYQQLVWKFDAGSVVGRDLVAPYLEWHKAVWHSDSLNQTLDVSVVYTPILLRTKSQPIERTYCS
ncbi:P-loop containing nucleoside triphosphate hydrolase protein [Fomitiporia mediterranea MF3/22]|uniref:P-loop containing nucleoside triphosphate hydrolase protein n=1 Tax=Fomitiporia mediterranea (strain MF3/22) TaxID=694068 RepID=UPI0004408B97|nr:P-loop containing nucleoside triphosphate hydrolase protein [Fomitiporia mediterranea MF3/22]EJC98837.1 P-loop containing nucleoside triphosphate hydrolase protein [Fomitiporia mediterranea MF3/22]